MPHGAISTVSCHGECYKYDNQNPTGKDVFVPTKTAPEFSSFYTGLNRPSSVLQYDCNFGHVIAGWQCTNQTLMTAFNNATGIDWGQTQMK